MHTLHARSSIVDVYNGSVVQMLGAGTLTLFEKNENTVPPPPPLSCVCGGEGMDVSYLQMYVPLFSQKPLDSP